MIRDKRFLVTGASGFVGKATCARLLSEGAMVDGASRSPVEFDSTAWRHWQVDLSISEDVKGLFNEIRPDYVVHLASSVTGNREVEWVLDTLKGNLLSAVNILVEATNSGAKKIVLAGSLEEPPRGVSNVVPASPYAASKWSASGYARMFHALYGVSVAVARIFMVYGPGQADHTKLVPYACLSAANNEDPQLMSGERLVDWIYVDDVVEGLIRMTQTGVVDGGYVDLGTGNPVTTGDVVTAICKLSGTSSRPAIGALPDRPMEQIRQADIQATEKCMGWHPEVQLDVGLKKTFAYYRELLARGE